MFRYITPYRTNTYGVSSLFCPRNLLIGRGGKQGPAMAKKAVEKTDGKKSEGVVVNQAEIDELEASPTFSANKLLSAHSMKPFFYFHFMGDSLEGFLGPQHNNRNINRTCSRIIETKTGVEEFFTNRQLAKVIKKYELEGKYVRVTYIGNEPTGWGHKRKCYKVEKFAVTDHEQMSVQSGAPGPRKTKGISK